MTRNLFLAISLFALAACGDKTYITNVTTPAAAVSVRTSEDVLMDVGGTAYIFITHRIPGRSDLRAGDTVMVSVADGKVVRATRKYATHFSGMASDIMLPFIEVYESWEISGLALGTTRVTFTSGVDKKQQAVALANVVN